MLTWMQHHRKYLIITIWISTIALVGAVFVNWGAYDFNLDRTSNAAIVGNEKISYNEFNTRYNQIFNYYNQISNGSLDENNAEKIGLKELALNSLIEDKLLLNFAKDLGLNSNDNEIIEKLTQTRAFQNPIGEFNKTIYYEILHANGFMPKDYEKILSDEVIIDKLNKIFNLPSSESEIKMLAIAYFMKDSLSIAELNYDKKNIKINEEELKKFWEQQKEDYKTSKTYEISTYFLPLNDQNFSEEELQKFYNDANNRLNYKDQDGKILDFKLAKNKVAKDYGLIKLKNLANAKFLELKNNKEKFQKDENISDLNIYYPLDLLSKIKTGDLLRPVRYKDGYMIIKINKINPIRIKTFEEARNEILPLYLSEKSKENLEKEAEERLKDFKGENIGFVTRDSLLSDIKMDKNIFNNAEFSYFLTNVFNSDQNASYVLLGDNKAVLYKINKQKIDISDDKLNQHYETLKQNLQILKSDMIKQELINQLRKAYPIKIYYKGK
ncbi:peptidylprolyl isomerase [Campylobacter molothri]|uniref:peptidylprolyl isomerase n=1 Tax=Campylobacter molothri TaxID=1032242 RepID=UPI0035AFA822